MQSTSQDTITFSCPSCSTTLQVDAALAGQTGPCPVCSNTITAPHPEPEPQPQNWGRQPEAPAPSPPAAPPVQESPPQNEGLSGLPPYGYPTGEAERPQPQVDQIRSEAPQPPAPPEPPAIPQEPEGRARNPWDRPVSDPPTAAPQGGEDYAWSRNEGLVDQGLMSEPQPPADPGEEKQWEDAPVEEEDSLLTGKVRQTGFPVGWAILLVLVFAVMGFFIHQAIKPDSVSGPTADDGTLVAKPAPEVLEVSEEEIVMEEDIPAAPGVAEIPPNPLLTEPEIKEPEEPVEAPAPIVARPIKATLIGSLETSEEPVEVASLSMETVETPEPAPAELASEETSREMAEPRTGRLDGPRNAIQHFLQAPNWQERMAWVYDAETLQDRVRNYYETNADEPVMDYRLDFFHNEEQEGGRMVYVFYLTMPSQREGFPVIVLKENEEFRVDWDLFIEFRDQHFRQFVEEGPSDPRVFRVVVQRGTYWESDREEIPDVDSLICYRIDPPYPGAERQYAFVKADSAEGKALVSRMSWETPPMAGQVELEWKQFSNGKPWLAINRLVSEIWADEPDGI